MWISGGKLASQGQPAMLLLAFCLSFNLDEMYVKEEYAAVVSPQVHCEYVEAQLLDDAFLSLRIPLCFFLIGSLQKQCHYVEILQRLPRGHFGIKTVGAEAGKWVRFVVT